MAPPLKPSDVAKRFGVTVTTVANWADKGKLPSFRTPGGQRRFREEDVAQFEPADDENEPTAVGE